MTWKKFIVFTVSCFLAGLVFPWPLVLPAEAAKVDLSWDANPAAENVTRYHLFREDPATGLKHFLAESTGTSATVDLEPGEHRLVAACENAHGWSAFSDPLVVWVVAALPAPGAPMMARPARFFLQSSTNLTEWTDEIEILNKPPGAKFWRVKEIRD